MCNEQWEWYLRRIGGAAKMRGLVTGELTEQIVDFAGLHVFGKPSDEESANLVAGGLWRNRRAVRGEHWLLVVVRHILRVQVVRRRVSRARRRWHHRHQGRRRRRRRVLVILISEGLGLWVVGSHVVHRIRSSHKISPRIFSPYQNSIPATCLSFFFFS